MKFIKKQERIVPIDNSTKKILFFLSNIFVYKNVTISFFCRHVYHLQNDLEDTLYSPPYFTITEEVCEIINYKKTTISFDTINGRTSCR